MRIEERDGDLLVISESREDNRIMRNAGIDADRLSVGIHITRGEEVQEAGDTPFEPLIVVLRAIEEDIDIREDH